MPALRPLMAQIFGYLLNSISAPFCFIANFDKSRSRREREIVTLKGFFKNQSLIRT